MKKKLNWDDLADIYDKENGGLPARCQSMNAIADWAENHPELIIIDSEGYCYKKEEDWNGYKDKEKSKGWKESKY